MCWISWDKMTKPKAGGGLGFRDIQLFNQALLAKQAWRILTKPNNLLARILIGKYCHKQSFLKAQCPVACSHGWRSILHGRDLLVGNIGKVIGNGRTTRVWQDSWISLTEQSKPFGPVSREGMDLMVSDLLTNDLQWNKERIKEFLPLLSDKIQCLQPSKTGAEDSFIWLPTKSGEYSTKSGYASVTLGTRSPQEPPNGCFEWIKDVWSTSCSQKMKVFMWSVIQKALPFGENLQSRGIQAQALCPRCNETESAMHIFFECSFAREVWKMIPLHKEVPLATQTDFKDAIVAFRKIISLPPSGITGTILPWVCWVLWTARNTLIFEGRTLSQQEVTTKAIRSAREWNLAQDHKEKTNQSIPESGVGRRSPIQNQTVICKSDAAWEKNTNRGGLGWIISDRTGAIVKKRSTIQDHVSSPIVAEALALRLGLIAAVNLNLTSIRMISDNQTLIRAINNDTQAKEIYGIVHDIQQISSVFVDISFSHLSRKNFVEVDLLAKSTLKGHHVITPAVG